MMTDESYSRYYEPVKPEAKPGRRPCARDFDRILYSPEFRRLGGVTQVMDSQETGLVHTRLTHSLKVAQTARRLAEMLEKKEREKEEGKEEDPRVPIDVDAAEAAGLAHDIGHPPFGHIAEKVLDEKMGNTDSGFEGNAQTFRILTRLSKHSTAYGGLNLTRKTLQAVAKYPNCRAASRKSHNHEKFNYYVSDAEMYKWSRKGLTEPDKRTIEAEIMDWADDIAYAVHDFEDFVLGGWIPLDTLTGDSATLEPLFSDIRKEFESETKIEDDVWRTNYVEPTAKLLRVCPSSRGRAEISDFVSFCVNAFVNATSIKDGELHVAGNWRNVNRVFKQITWRYVINSRQLSCMQKGQKKIVESLFDFYSDELKEPGHNWILPEWCETGVDYSSDDSRRKRVVCDLVASLTEPQAISVFKQISGSDSVNNASIRW